LAQRHRGRALKLVLVGGRYAVLYRWRFEHSLVNALYGVAFAGTFAGLLVYQLPPPVNAPKPGQDEAPPRKSSGAEDVGLLDGVVVEDGHGQGGGTLEEAQPPTPTQIAPHQEGDLKPIS
jgi:hypothetical protein